MAFIKAEDLSFQYPLDSKKSLIKLNFEIEKGEFILLCGETGCGKSTLLRQMKPSVCPVGEKSGKIIFRDMEFHSLDKRIEAKTIGFVTQNPDNQIVTDKVWHELAFTLENLGVQNEEIRRRVAEIAAFFDITHWFEKSVHELSGGQKQILNLASAMIARPKLLLLDEPMSQLDPVTAQKFIELLVRINEELQTTVIMAEHRMEEAFSHVDRCLVMEDGKILIFDKTEVITRYLLEERKKQFDILPSQARIPALLCMETGCRTIRQAKECLYQNEVVFPCMKFEKSQNKIKKQNVLFDIKNIWFRYNKSDLDILKDFSMKIEKGDFLCITGTNGQGKTTLLNIICNVMNPYRGKVLYHGKYVKKNVVPADIAYLPQNPQNLFLKKTVQEDLQTISYDIDEVVALLHLEELLPKHSYDLSGGQQQLAALGKILLKNPKVLLLDEPTKGIDKRRRLEMGKLLMDLNDKGMTIILASHDIDFCVEYGKHAAMIFQGSLLSFEDVRSFCKNQYFYTTSVRKIMRGIAEEIVTEREIENEG